MESPHVSSHGAAARPSLGFPLGTALLLVVIFSLSGIFSCCYHWDKLRRTFSLDALDLQDAQLASPNSKLKHEPMDMKQQKNESLPVMMPGDKVARFIAMPCPCEPPREDHVIVEIQKPPPKPPRITAPLY